MSSGAGICATPEDRATLSFQSTDTFDIKYLFGTDYLEANISSVLRGSPTPLVTVFSSISFSILLRTTPEITEVAIMELSFSANATDGVTVVYKNQDTVVDSVLVPITDTGLVNIPITAGGVGGVTEVVLTFTSQNNQNYQVGELFVVGCTHKEGNSTTCILGLSFDKHAGFAVILQIDMVSNPIV